VNILLPVKVFNYCPKCGSKLLKSTEFKTNFCHSCGHKLLLTGRDIQQNVQCAVCHEFIWHRSAYIINCSFCGSEYHNICVHDWLAKYNSCPMCQNVFLNPNLIVSRSKI